MGNARPIDGRPQSDVQVGPDKLEVVASFCYLGEMLSAGGGCEIMVTTHVKTAWKKFRETQERSTWRSGVRSVLCAASQLPGKGPTDLDDAPAPAR